MKTLDGDQKWFYMFLFRINGKRSPNTHPNNFLYDLSLMFFKCNLVMSCSCVRIFAKKLGLKRKEMVYL